MIGYYGGFRICELKNLTFANLKQDQLGYWFEFVRSKQRGKTATTSILVPRRQSDWVPVVDDAFRSATDIDPASFVDVYLEQLQADFGVSMSGLNGSFFRGTQGKKGGRFIKTPMGKNKISQIGIEFAAELGFEDPNCYTGHCWRRSCGTSASDAGVNVTTLMSLMGWATPKTALEYVNKSKEKCIKMSLYLTNVQRQNRPLILSENEFKEVSRNVKKSSSKSSLASISNVRSVSKNRKAGASFELVDPLTTVSIVPACKDEHSDDVAALVREIDEEEEVFACSQALISDLELNEEKVFDAVSVVSASSVQSVSPVVSVSSDPLVSSEQTLSSLLETVGPCLTGMFPNLVNNGSLNINVYFGK